jgi:hypothetical protein
MRLYQQRDARYPVLLCDMEDGRPSFKVGWVQHTQHINKFYCKCMWMTHGGDHRDWLYPEAYPENHMFDTSQEAEQALLECAIVVLLAGFRGRHSK